MRISMQLVDVNSSQDFELNFSQLPNWYIHA